MKCIHCLQKLKKKTRDHVFPDSWYPDNTPDNVQRPTAPSCGSCNNRYGALEEEFLYKLGLCLDHSKAEASGINKKNLRSLGVGNKHELSEKELQTRREIGQRIISEMRPYSPDLGIPLFPGLEHHSKIPEKERAVLLLPEGLIEECVRKIVRGLEYINGNSRYIESPYQLQVFAFPKETKVKELEMFHTNFENFGVISNFGPGFRVERVNFNVNGHNLTSYKILIWGQILVYANIALANLEEYGDITNERCLKPQADSWKSIKFKKESESIFFPTENDLKNLEDNPTNNYESKEIADLLEDLIPNTHPFDLVKSITENALLSFKKDRSLIPTFLLFFPNEKKYLMLSDQDSKFNLEYQYAFINFIAEEIVNNNIDFVISRAAGRIYFALDDKTIIPSIENKENAVDVIQIFYFSSQMGKIIHVPFHKDLSEEVTFSKPIVINYNFQNNAPLPFCFRFDPIIYALKKVARKMKKT